MVGGILRNFIARVNSDGTLDTAFNPNANGGVYSLAIQTDGRILLGGWFSKVGGTTRNNLARLNADGTLDSSCNPNVNTYATCVGIQIDGKILLSGSFTSVGGMTRDYIARLLNGPATQSLVITNKTRVQWVRSGTAPEIERTAFDLSTDGGINWAVLGSGMRSTGVCGWEKTGVTLPSSGLIRARGRAADGVNSRIIEQVASFNFPDNGSRIIIPPQLTNGLLHVGFEGGPNMVYSVHYSTNVMGPWCIFTNLQSDNNGRFDLFDVTKGAAQRYYRIANP